MLDRLTCKYAFKSDTDFRKMNMMVDGNVECKEEKAKCGFAKKRQ